MQINPTGLLQTNTIAKNGTAMVTEQGAAFADRLNKAVTAKQQVPSSPETDLAKRSQDAKLKAACQEMEAVFLNIMLSRMRATVPESKLVGGSSQEKTMRSLLDTELTKNMAQAGGMGLADMLYRQLTIPNVIKGQAAK